MDASHEAGVARVTIDHFNLTAEEISRLWAAQDKYIDLLESSLGKATQREQKMMSKLLKKKQELFEITAKLEKLKGSRVSELGLSEGGWVCNKCYCQALRKKDICQIPSCPASNKSPENIKRVCNSCFRSFDKSMPKSVALCSSRKMLVKKSKKVRLYSILKPRKSDFDYGTKGCPSVDQSGTDTATETEEEQSGSQESGVFTKPPSVDQSETDTATETEEEQSGSQESEVSTKPSSVDQSETNTAAETEEEQGGSQDSEVSTKFSPSLSKEQSPSPLKCEKSNRTRSLSTQTLVSLYSNTGLKGVKLSEEEKKQGALLFYSSPITYKLLRSFSNERYPCPRTIQTYVEGFRCSFGINEEMFFLLSQMIQTLIEIDRNVALVFDEIALQPQTEYSQHLKMRLPPAKKAMVVMVRGLRKSFKEVIFYDFDRGMDMNLLVELIKQVERAGAAVRAVTLDMGNQTLLKECKVNCINVKPYQSFIFLCFLILGIARSLLLFPPEQC